MLVINTYGTTGGGHTLFEELKLKQGSFEGTTNISKVVQDSLHFVKTYYNKCVSNKNNII